VLEKYHDFFVKALELSCMAYSLFTPVSDGKIKTFKFNFV